MIIFRHLFAANYFLLMSIRRSRFLKPFSRGGEDFGAMCFVVCSQFHLLCLIVWILKTIFKFELPVGLNSKQVLFCYIITAVWFYSGYKYFISDNLRKNRFIDQFNSMSKRNQVYWKSFAMFLMLVPVWFLLYILMKR